MTTEKLKEANELSTEIKEMDDLILKAEKQICHWIEFTFGNGSSKSVVCRDLDTIEKVRTLIIDENKKKLAELIEQFENL